MKVSKEEILHLAHLSALKFSDAEIAKFENEFEVLVDFVNQIQNAKVSNQLNFENKINMNNLREDVAGESLDNSLVLKNAPDSKNGAFRVPKAVN